jgi:hypothetical protein
VQQAVADEEGKAATALDVHGDEIGTGQVIEYHVGGAEADKEITLMLCLGHPCHQLSSGIGGAVVLEPPKNEGTEGLNAEGTHVTV